MTTLDTGVPTRFFPTAEAHKPEAERTAYLLRPPKVLDQPKLRRLAKQMGAIAVSVATVGSVLRAGIREVAVTAEEAAEHIATLDDCLRQAEELGRASTALLGVTDEAALAELRERHDIDEMETRLRELEDAAASVELIVKRHVQAYRDMEADQAYWSDVVPLAAIRLLCVGAEGPAAPKIPTPAPGDPLGLAELDRIPEQHLIELGNAALASYRPGEGQEKN